MQVNARDADLLRIVRLVAALNLADFGIEFIVALRIGSVSLFVDGVDLLEDASIDLLIMMSLGWSVAARARIVMLLAAILLVPGLATRAADFIGSKAGQPSRRLPPSGPRRTGIPARPASECSRRKRERVRP